jgi:hypothetical protein
MIHLKYIAMGLCVLIAIALVLAGMVMGVTFLHNCSDTTFYSIVFTPVVLLVSYVVGKDWLT